MVVIGGDEFAEGHAEVRLMSQQIYHLLPELPRTFRFFCSALWRKESGQHDHWTASGRCEDHLEAVGFLTSLGYRDERVGLLRRDGDGGVWDLGQTIWFSH